MALPSGFQNLLAYIYQDELAAIVSQTDSGRLYLTVFDLRLAQDAPVDRIQRTIPIKEYPEIVAVIKRHDDVTYDILWGRHLWPRSESSPEIGRSLVDLFNKFTVRRSHGPLGITSCLQFCIEDSSSEYNPFFPSNHELSGDRGDCCLFSY